MRSMSDVLRETGIDNISLLKVDVEGSEMDVLAGIAKDDWAKIRQIVMEIHDADGERVAKQGPGWKVRGSAAYSSKRSSFASPVSSFVTRFATDKRALPAAHQISRWRRQVNVRPYALHDSNDFSHPESGRQQSRNAFDYIATAVAAYFKGY